jgi:hypothetical protein
MSSRVVHDLVSLHLPDEDDPVIAHEQEWDHPHDSEDVMLLNGAVARREGFIGAPTGEMLR